MRSTFGKILVGFGILLALYFILVRPILESFDLVGWLRHPFGPATPTLSSKASTTQDTATTAAGKARTYQASTDHYTDSVQAAGTRVQAAAQVGRRAAATLLHQANHYRASHPQIATGSHADSVRYYQQLFAD